MGKLIGYDISCIRAEAYILKGITENEHGDYNGTPFISALSLWVERMDYFSSSIEPSGREGIYEIYSPEKAAYAHLKSIADYFEMLDLQHHKIICVRLLIKFIPLCRLGEEKEVNSIICLAYIELCFSYLKLRLTEEAEAALEQAYNLMKGKEHYQIVSTNYIATYAYYLACFGHTSKAKQYISVAVKQAFSEPAQDDIYIPDWMAYSGKYLQSYVFLCSAAISLLSGDVVTAVQSAEASFELLVKAFMHTLPDVCSSFISIKTPAASQEQKPDNQKARSISKNGNSLSLSRMGNSLAELNLWSYAGKLMNVYNMLGMSYTYRGSSEEADYYYEQGLEIAQLNSSKVLQCHFHANIADVSSRRNLPEKSSKNLEGCYKSLKRIANSSEVPLIHLVHLKFCTGNYRFRNNDVDTAIGLYKEAELHIRKCTTKIDGTFLEIVLPKALSLTKDLLLDKQYKTADQTMLKSVHKDDPTDTMFYLFQCLMVEIATRVSMALMKKSSVSDAEAALISVESLRHRQIEQSEYYGALTKLKMLKVVQQLKQHTNHSAFFDSVFSLPLICATSGCETSRLDNPTRKKAGDRANSISSILSFFKKAFHLAYLYGPSIQIHEIAHSISYLCVMEAYLPGHTSLGATIELASLSTLYLDISKGYTTKKEFVCTTKDKFGASEERTADSDCITSHNHTHTPGAEGGLAARGAWRDLYNYYMCEDTADPIVYETAQKLLPDDWIIFSISIDTERADLYISRYSRSEKLMLRLPISRKSVRSDTRQEFPDLDKVSSTFGELLRENREVMGYAGSCVTPELKADWWKKRKVINDKLRNLIDTVEEEWFGAFRGIFSMDKLSYAEFDGHIEVFKAGLEQLISTHIEFKDMTLDDSASRGYIDTKLCKIILSLGPDVSYNDLEDIIYFILSSYQYTGSNIDYSSLSLETISDTLVALIRDFYRSIRKVPSLHNPKHIILILDRNLQFFPWESMSTLRSLPSCRLPTLSFLRDHLLKLSISGESREVEETPYTSVDPSNCFYLLNPGNDLSTTQKTFKLYLERYCSHASLAIF